MEPRFSNVLRRRVLQVVVAAVVATTAGAAAAATALYDFSSLPDGAVFEVGDTLAPANATFEFTGFQTLAGVWLEGGLAIVVESTNPKELALQDITLRVAPNPSASFASVRYVWRSGDVSVAVNGARLAVTDPAALDGVVLGGCVLAVTQKNAPGGVRGLLRVTPQASESVEALEIGGHDLGLTQLRHDW